MISKIYSAALKGLESCLIEVEVAVSPGLRYFNIVGLPDKAIEESKERIGVAIKNLQLASPHQRSLRVLVNLAPADLKKEGTLYDLPIALGYLLCSKQTYFNPQKKLFVGELALNGELKPIKGALSFALLAKEKEIEEFILPQENAKEASLVNLLKGKKVKIYGMKSLKDVLAHLEKRKTFKPFEFNPEEIKKSNPSFEIDFGWIKGQFFAKRALEIAAAGGHNVFLEGPPGAGKTLLAKSIISILPPLEIEEIIELTKIYSVAGHLPKNQNFVPQRPFRSPHHSCSCAALIGGGNPPNVGEITLSHRGVLFLDEFPEFHRDVLESLRQPLEEGEITIQRARYSYRFPAKFTLIAASNPCPCGYFGDPQKECRCTPSQIASYRRKLSGPLIDRFDIFCWVPSLKYEDLISENPSDCEEIKEKIKKARIIQKERFKKEGIFVNAEMKIPQIKKYCQIPPSSQHLLKKYINCGKLSARGYQLWKTFSKRVP